MKNLRTWITTVSFTLLLGTLSACIIETRPDRSMLIYVPPPVIQSSGRPDLTVQQGTIPGTIPAPMAPDLLAEAQQSLAASTAITQTAAITDTPVLTVTRTITESLSDTLPITGTLPATMTSVATPTSGTLASTTIAGTTIAGTTTPRSATPIATGTSPTRSGTRIVTPIPTRQATGTARATATRTATRTMTATRKPTSTATRRATATAATPIATATAIPRTVFIGRNQGFMADARYYVVGEVLNGDAYPVFNVKVIGSFYDSSNNLVAAEESITIFPQIEPELSSPFKLQVANGASNIDHYELTLTWDDVSVIDYEELVVEEAEVDEEAGTINGELRNDGSVSVQNITVVVTLYDDENNVVNVLLGQVDEPLLGTDETTGYTISLPPDIVYERFEVQAQGVLKLF